MGPRRFFTAISPAWLSQPQISRPWEPSSDTEQCPFHNPRKHLVHNHTSSIPLLLRPLEIRIIPHAVRVSLTNDHGQRGSHLAGRVANADSDTSSSGVVDDPCGDMCASDNDGLVLWHKVRVGIGVVNGQVIGGDGGRPGERSGQALSDVGLPIISLNRIKS